MAKSIDTHFYRDLPSYLFRERELRPAFLKFFEAVILPRIDLRGFKKLPAKIELLRQMTRNLISTGLPGACVRDTRDSNCPGAKLRRQLWDRLIAANLCDWCKGSEQSGKVTRYRATASLIRLRKLWKLNLLEDIRLARNTNLKEPTDRALVVVNRGSMDLATGEPLAGELRKKPQSLLKAVQRQAQRGPNGKPLPQAVKNGLTYFRKIEDQLEVINRSNQQHEWRAFYVDEETNRKTAFEPNVSLRQIHAGQLHRGVRLYSFGPMSGQNLSKKVRKRMTIDGEPAAEFDYKGFHTRMLYHLHVGDPCRTGDIYRPELVLPKFYSFENAKTGCVRDFVKCATNICWNVSSRSKANSAVGNLLAEYADRKFLKDVIYNIEETTPTGIVDRIMAAHPELTKFFFTEIGMELMTTDGQIMFQILSRFAKAQKPALGIHDSVVCRASDAEFAESAMTRAYRKFCPFRPVIKRVF